jgi:hypothetical protein
MLENILGFAAVNREAPKRLSSTIAIVTQPGWLRTFFFPSTHSVPTGRSKSVSEDFRPERSRSFK